eukprot:SAG25_NODE_1107_length_3951_cov_1.802960_2_plen_83_part_01
MQLRDLIELNNLGKPHVALLEMARFHFVIDAFHELHEYAIFLFDAREHVLHQCLEQGQIGADKLGRNCLADGSNDQFLLSNEG